MSKINIADRLTFIAEQFDVFDCSDITIFNNKLEEIEKSGFKTKILRTVDSNDDEKILAIVSTKEREKKRINKQVFKKISICSDVFSSIIMADPTESKIYVQWMLNIFSKLIKEGGEINIDSAIRFINEDLPQANSYLQIFEGNKRKKTFSDLCKSSYSLKLIEDPTNINQYKSLAQLFDAVDPFIEKEPSALERTLQKFVNSGQAEIPVKDRNFTLYIPKTLAASVIFENFANWCTAKKGNGNFKNYTTNYKKPNGENSDIYIIINNKFFTGESEDLFQIHFETDQLKNKSNGSNVSIFESVLNKSDGITNYFKEELMVMAKQNKKGIDNNKYLDYLIKFGFAECLFDIFDENTPSIRVMKKEIPKLPDISRFKLLDQFSVCDAQMVELHPTIGDLVNLQMISLTGNKLKTIPKEIGKLKNLKLLILTGNPINDIPTEIKYLDKSNGGSLFRLGIKVSETDANVLKKLKELLPTTLID